MWGRSDRTVCGHNLYHILTSTQKFMQHDRSLLTDVEVLLGVMVKTSRCGAICDT